MEGRVIQPPGATPLFVSEFALQIRVAISYYNILHNKHYGTYTDRRLKRYRIRKGFVLSAVLRVIGCINDRALECDLSGNCQQGTTEPHSYSGTDP